MQSSNFVVWLAGLVFGLGLLVSGMTQPDKVIGFLDLTGDWDPSLAFVMGGALAVHAPLSWLLRRKRKGAEHARPRYAPVFHLPTRRDIDRPLVAGAALFGVGWGLAGLCPGPAIVSAGGGSFEALVFVGTMTLGMLLHDRVRRVETNRPPPEAPLPGPTVHGHIEGRLS